ncbi:MAG: hypothetical protein QOF57_2500, partial [Frankiaceae bacterium]|nr:hypothetical protein [Frankiaceae bacterium]
QWQRCAADGTNCTDISAATGATYDVVSADVGHAIRVLVTGTNAGGSDTATSAATTAIDPAKAANTGTPSISGPLLDGGILTADHGTWTGTPAISYAYQWQRCDADGSNCTDIPLATDDTYELTAADIGHAIRVVVTATNGGGSDNASSAPSAAVVAEAPSNTGAPSISGTPADGATLTADKGAWSGTGPLDFTYQWQRCDGAGANCTDIAGATSSTHDLTAADVGHTIVVVVTGTNAGGSDTASSAPSSVVAADPPSNTGAPTITGTPAEGHTLTADHGTWSGTGPLAYAYQWQRCDADGTNCTDIPGATGPTYDPVGADVGHTLVVVVTATNAGGSSTGTADATASVAAKPAPPATPTPTPTPTPEPAAPPAAQPQPEPEPAPAPAVLGDIDLSGLPGSLVAESQCQQLASGGAFRRVRSTPAGDLRLRVKADGVVAPDVPAAVSVAAPGLGKVRMALTLDGRTLHTTGARTNQSTTLAPKALGRLGTHKLQLILKGAKGKPMTVSVPLKTLRCATRFTSLYYATTGGTGLRLRVDSVRPLGTVGFVVPPALALRSERKARPAAARLRIVSAPGKQQVITFGLPAGRAAGTMASTVKGVSLRYTKTGFAVSGLPAKTGIVDLTVYQSRKAGLKLVKPGSRRLVFKAKLGSATAALASAPRSAA